jgi:hypothetical protein
MNTNRTLMTLIRQIIADKIIIYHNHLRHLRSIISFSRCPQGFCREGMNASYHATLDLPRAKLPHHLIKFTFRQPSSILYPDSLLECVGTGRLTVECKGTRLNH